MATGVQDVGAAVTSLRQGVIDYLDKAVRPRPPARGGDARHRVARAACDSRRWRETLEGEMEARRARLARRARGADASTATRRSTRLLSMLTLTDRDAYAHAYRVAALAASVGARAAASRRRRGRARARRAAARRRQAGDAGSGPAQAGAARPSEEQALIRRHPQIGAELIAARAVPGRRRGAGARRARADGRPRLSGWPPRGGRRARRAHHLRSPTPIDAMTRPRVFRDAIGPAEALLELERCAGTAVRSRAWSTPSSGSCAIVESPGSSESVDRGSTADCRCAQSPIHRAQQL